MNHMIGQKFGLVTVVRRDGYATRGRPVWFGVCECGRGRYFQTSNLLKRPPKTHRFCHRGINQLELPLDNVREQAYEGAS